MRDCSCRPTSRTTCTLLILEADPALFDYLTHPRLVGTKAEELVGSDVRLEESEGRYQYAGAGADVSAPPRYGFHVGTWPDVGTYTANDLFLPL